MQPNIVDRRVLPWDVEQFKWSDLLALILTLIFGIIIALMVRYIVITVPPKSNNDLERNIDLTPPPLVVEAPKPVEVKEEPETKTEQKAEPQTKKQESPRQASKPRAVEVPKASDDSGKEGRSAARDVARERARRAVLDTGLANAVVGTDTYGTDTDSRDIDYGAKTNNAGGTKFSAGDIKRAGTGTGARGTGPGAGQFGSATGADRTGSGTGSLTGKSSKGVGGGAEIVGKGASNSSGKTEASAKKRSDFYDVMERAKGRVNSAYKRALDEDPTLEGSVSVRVQVSSDGNVTSASIDKSSINNNALESQIVTIVRALRFATGDYDPYTAVFTYKLIN